MHTYLVRSFNQMNEKSTDEVLDLLDSHENDVQHFKFFPVK